MEKWIYISIYPRLVTDMTGNGQSCNAQKAKILAPNQTTGQKNEGYFEKKYNVVNDEREKQINRNNNKYNIFELIDCQSLIFFKLLTKFF